MSLQQVIEKKSPLAPNSPSKDAPKKSKLMPLAKKKTSEEEAKAEEKVTKKITPLKPKKETAEEPEIVETIEEETEKSSEAEKPEATQVSEEKEKEEEKPKRKRWSSKNKEKEEAAKELPPEEMIELPTTKVSFTEAVKMIRPQFEDKEWHDLKEQIQDLLNQAIITADTDPGSMAVIRENLATARALIEQDYAYYQAEVNRLGGKEPKGLIQRTELFYSTGSNEIERKRNGMLACMQQKDGTVNLYEMYDEYNERYLILKGFMETIKWRSDILINIAATLKLEQQHLPSQT